MSEISLHLISCSIWPYRLKRCPFLQLLPVWLDLDVGPGALGSGLLSGWYFPKLQTARLSLCVMLLKVQMAASFRHSLMGQRQKSNAMLTLTMIKGTWAEFYGGRMTILDHLKNLWFLKVCRVVQHKLSECQVEAVQRELSILIMDLATYSILIFQISLGSIYHVHPDIKAELQYGTFVLNCTKC